MSNSSSSSSSQQSSVRQRRLNRFEDSWEQLSTSEIAPRLWLSVNKLKSNHQVYVDIRRKREEMTGNGKIFIPTKVGLFMHHLEYEKLKQILTLATDGQQRPFEISEISGRTISGHLRVDGCWHITLKTQVKESTLSLAATEVRAIVDCAIPMSVSATDNEIIWG